jgi:hypothetical protein
MAVCKVSLSASGSSHVSGAAQHASNQGGAAQHTSSFTGGAAQHASEQGGAAQHAWKQGGEPGAPETMEEGRFIQALCAGTTPAAAPATLRSTIAATDHAAKCFTLASAPSLRREWNTEPGRGERREDDLFVACVAPRGWHRSCRQAAYCCCCGSHSSPRGSFECAARACLCRICWDCAAGEARCSCCDASDESEGEAESRGVPHAAVGDPEATPAGMLVVRPRQSRASAQSQALATGRRIARPRQSRSPARSDSVVLVSQILRASGVASNGLRPYDPRERRRCAGACQVAVAGIHVRCLRPWVYVRCLRPCYKGSRHPGSCLCLSHRRVSDHGLGKANSDYATGPQLQWPGTGSLSAFEACTGAVALRASPNKLPAAWMTPLCIAAPTRGGEPVDGAESVSAALHDDDKCPICNDEWCTKEDRCRPLPSDGAGNLAAPDGCAIGRSDGVLLLSVAGRRPAPLWQPCATERRGRERGVSPVSVSPRQRIWGSIECQLCNIRQSCAVIRDCDVCGVMYCYQFCGTVIPQRCHHCKDEPEPVDARHPTKACHSVLSSRESFAAAVAPADDESAIRHADSGVPQVDHALRQRILGSIECQVCGVRQFMGVIAECEVCEVMYCYQFCGTESPQRCHRCKRWAGPVEAQPPAESCRRGLSPAPQRRSRLPACFAAPPRGNSEASLAIAAHQPQDESLTRHCCPAACRPCELGGDCIAATSQATGLFSWAAAPRHQQEWKTGTGKSWRQCRKLPMPQVKVAPRQRIWGSCECRVCGVRQDMRVIAGCDVCGVMYCYQFCGTENPQRCHRCKYKPEPVAALEAGPACSAAFCCQCGTDRSLQGSAECSGWVAHIEWHKCVCRLCAECATSRTLCSCAHIEFFKGVTRSEDGAADESSRGMEGRMEPRK